MSSRTIDVIGGGPAGLTTARLIKLADPGAKVTVHERSSANASTFGFGVGLTESTMRNLDAADPETAEKVREASYAGHRLTLRENGHDVELHGARNLAIGRATLLEVLGRAAVEIGVVVRMGSSFGWTDSNADVVVAADGANSSVRGKLETELGLTVEHGDLHFMWCGADFATDTAFFASRGHGDAFFVAHAYPYADDRSTFLIEADAVTWEAAGLAENHASVGRGETDTSSIALLEEVFAEELGGRRLLTNRTRWARFPTVSLERWFHRNVVFVGDAAHTAHYTVGSGTKLAIEDGIALAEALAEHDDVTEAFTAYQSRRQPPVDRFRSLAARSQTWWETYRDRRNRTSEAIALSYMTRAGNLTVADYATQYPGVAREAMRHLGVAPVERPELLDDWILGRPAPPEFGADEQRRLASVPSGPAVRLVDWDEHDAIGVEAEALLESVSGAAGQEIVLLRGPSCLEAVGARFDLAERLRVRGGRSVVVSAPESFRSMAAAAVAARRCDAVVLH